MISYKEQRTPEFIHLSNCIKKAFLLLRIMQKPLWHFYCFMVGWILALETHKITYSLCVWKSLAIWLYAQFRVRNSDFATVIKPLYLQVKFFPNFCGFPHLCYLLSEDFLVLDTFLSLIKRYVVSIVYYFHQTKFLPNYSQPKKKIHPFAFVWYEIGLSQDYLP